MKIVSKEVKKLNNTSGYIPMKYDEVGKEFIVMTLRELEFLIGRKYEQEIEKEK
jgi:hypothetical protein